MRRLVLFAVLGLLAFACADSETRTNESSATSTPSASSASPTAIATSATAATTTAAAPATVTPTEASGTANVVEDQFYIVPGSTDGTRFIGQVRNTGDAPAINIDITVTVYDAAGTVLASSGAGTLIMRPVLPPGEIMPFLGVLSDVLPDEIASQKIQIQFRDYDPKAPRVTQYTQDIEITQIRWTEDKIVGELTNTGDTPISSVYIIVAGYDADGNIRAVESVRAEVERLEPGMSSAFDESFLGTDVVPITFEAFPYASVVQ